MTNELVPKKDSKLPILKGGINKFRPRKERFGLVVKKISLPEGDSFDEKIAWLCSSLGFFNEKDKNKVACQIFKEVFLASTVGQVLTSTVIAERVGMSRGTTISHLNKLHNSGLIDKGGKYYFTRHKTMEGIIEELEDDLIHIFSRMKKIGKEIDKETSKVINLN